MVTFNNIISLFQIIATAHPQIKSFGVGDKWQRNQTQSDLYPRLWIEPTESTITDHTQERSFTLSVYDLVKKDKSNNQEVLSDTEQIINDIVVTLREQSEFYDLVGDPQFFQFTEELGDWVSGWEGDVVISSDLNTNRCAIPIGDFYSPNTPTEGGVIPSHFLTCDTLRDCGVILDIEDTLVSLQEQIDAIPPPNVGANRVAYGHPTTGDITGNPYFQFIGNVNNFADRSILNIAQLQIGNAPGDNYIQSNTGYSINYVSALGHYFQGNYLVATGVNSTGVAIGSVSPSYGGIFKSGARTADDYVIAVHKDDANLILNIPASSSGIYFSAAGSDKAVFKPNGSFQIGTGTPISFSNSQLDLIYNNGGGGAGMTVTNVATNGYTYWAIGESNSRYFSAQKVGSTFAGNLPGSSIPFADAAIFNSGSGYDSPFILGGSKIYNLIGTTSSSFGTKLDAQGFRIDTLANLHTDNVYPLYVGGSIGPALYTSANGKDVAMGLGSVLAGYVSGDAYVQGLQNNFRILGFNSYTEIKMKHLGAAASEIEYYAGTGLHTFYTQSGIKLSMNGSYTTIFRSTGNGLEILPQGGNAGIYFLSGNNSNNWLSNTGASQSHAWISSGGVTGPYTIYTNCSSTPVDDGSVRWFTTTNGNGTNYKLRIYSGGVDLGNAGTHINFNGTTISSTGPIQMLAASSGSLVIGESSSVNDYYNPNGHDFRGGRVQVEGTTSTNMYLYNSTGSGKYSQLVLGNNNTASAALFKYDDGYGAGFFGGTSIAVSAALVLQNFFAGNILAVKSDIVINLTDNTSTSYGTRLDVNGLRIGKLSTLHTSNNYILAAGGLTVSSDKVSAVGGQFDIPFYAASVVSSIYEAGRFFKADDYTPTPTVLTINRGDGGYITPPIGQGLAVSFGLPDGIGAQTYSADRLFIKAFYDVSGTTNSALSVETMTAGVVSEKFRVGSSSIKFGTNNINFLGTGNVLLVNGGNNFIFDNVNYISSVRNLWGVKTYFGPGLGTPTARIDIEAPDAATAQLRFKPSAGVSPSSPNDGEIWYDGTSLYMQVGGTTKTFVMI